MSEPPFVGFVAGEPRAVNSALLACADSDCLPVFDIANAVRLRVFQHDERNHQIAFFFFRKIFVFCNNVFEAGRINFQKIVSLFECDSENLLALQFRRNEIFIDLNHAIRALFFASKNFKRVRIVRWSDDSVGNFFCDELRRGFVARIRKRDEISETRHSVRATRARIRRSKRRKFDIASKINFFQSFGKRNADRRARRRNVLETRGRRKSGGFFQFFYKLPAVERVKQIYVAGATVQNRDWQISIFDKNPRRLLVRVASIF